MDVHHSSAWSRCLWSLSSLCHRDRPIAGWSHWQRSIGGPSQCPQLTRDLISWNRRWSAKNRRNDQGLLLILWLVELQGDRLLWDDDFLSLEERSFVAGEVEVVLMGVNCHCTTLGPVSATVRASVAAVQSGRVLRPWHVDRGTTWHSARA